MSLPAQYRELAASTTVIGGRGRLLGWSITETAGAAASVLLYDGIAGPAAGPVIARIALAAAGESTKWFGGQGIRFERGLATGAITGTLAGVIYFQPATMEGPNLIIEQSGSELRVRGITDASDLFDL